MLFAQDHIHLIRHLQQSNKAHSLDMLNLQFQLARIICHESIHAIEHARKLHQAPLFSYPEFLDLLEQSSSAERDLITTR